MRTYRTTGWGLVTVSACPRQGRRHALNSSQNAWQPNSSIHAVLAKCRQELWLSAVRCYSSLMRCPGHSHCPLSTVEGSGFMRLGDSRGTWVAESRFTPKLLTNVASPVGLACALGAQWSTVRPVSAQGYYLPSSVVVRVSEVPLPALHTLWFGCDW